MKFFSRAMIASLFTLAACASPSPGVDTTASALESTTAADDTPDDSADDAGTNADGKNCDKDGKGKGTKASASSSSSSSSSGAADDTADTVNEGPTSFRTLSVAGMSSVAIPANAFANLQMRLDELSFV